MLLLLLHMNTVVYSNVHEAGAISDLSQLSDPSYTAYL